MEGGRLKGGRLIEVLLYLSQFTFDLSVLYFLRLFLCIFKKIVSLQMNI